MNYRAIGFWGLVSLMSMGVGLGFFEIFLRVARPLHVQTIQGDKIIIPKNRVYVYGDINAQGVHGKIVITKNSLGFRGPNPPSDFQNWLTLVAVGGSTTECFYLTDGHDWPARVASRLQSNFNHLWVNNAGIDGHSTFAHQLLVDDYLSQLKPKVVLFLIGPNDISRMDLNFHDKKIIQGSGIKSHLLQLAREIQNRSRAVGFLQFSYRSLMAEHHAIHHGLADLRQAPRLHVPDERIEKLKAEHERLYIPGFETRLVSLIETCRRSGMDPVFMTTPSLFGTPVDDVTKVKLDDIQVDPQTNGKLSWELLELYNAATSRIAMQKGVLLLDLAAQMPMSSRYFLDYYHLSDEGSEEAAKIITTRLNPYLRTHYPTFSKSNAELTERKLNTLPAH